MHRTCFCLISVLSVVCAANLGYNPRQTQTQTQTLTRSQRLPVQGQPYYYNAPNAKTTAALQRIIHGHLQRFQEGDRQRAQLFQGRPEVPQPKQQPQQQQLQAYRKLSVAASQNILDYAVPPNTPTPKNYAMNFLPEGKDVAPGTSYIPLRLLLIRR